MKTLSSAIFASILAGLVISLPSCTTYHQVHTIGLERATENRVGIKKTDLENDAARKKRLRRASDRREVSGIGALLGASAGHSIAKNHSKNSRGGALAGGALGGLIGNEIARSQAARARGAKVRRDIAALKTFSSEFHDRESVKIKPEYDDLANKASSRNKKAVR